MIVQYPQKFLKVRMSDKKERPSKLLIGITIILCFGILLGGCKAGTATGPTAVVVTPPSGTLPDPAETKVPAPDAKAAVEEYLGYWKTNYIHDGNTNKGTKSVLFSPKLAAGNYQVFMRFPARSNYASNVPVDIASTTGITTVFVNERINGGTWVLLGTFSMDGSSTVLIRTGGTDGYVIVDALEFVPV